MGCPPKMPGPLHVRQSSLFILHRVFCLSVPIRSCVVSFAGEGGVRHSVEVTAETLYEAAAQALAILKESDWAGVIGPSTELRVTVKNPETTHHVTPEQ